MKMITLSLTLLLGIILTASAYAAEPNATKTQGDFVFDLYRIVAKDKANENVAVSPYCAELLLDFVRTGAAGETKSEIDKVLGRTDPIKWNEAIADSPLTVVTALWTQHGYPILPDFLQTAQKEFGASVKQADFSGNANEAVKQINAWCSEKTKEKIPVLFEKLNATTRCVLVGGIHFAADWKVPFEKDATIEGTFVLADDIKVKTPMMSQRGQMKYGETDETHILELPYKNNGYAMLLLLPKDSAQFVQWELEMTAEKLDAVRKTMKAEEVDLRMPRFTMESDLVLNEPLKQLGMPTAFSRDADFSKITGLTDLYLSEVQQKSFVKVDETGTEAAAVTGAVITVKSTLRDTKSFYANRPFLYVIVKGNTILFLGRFVKPDMDEPFVDPNLSGEGGVFS